MVRTKTCINIYSEMNPWIDFCIVLENENEIHILFEDWMKYE